MVATTLTVVSCLHRHASLDSMREVETFQPLASPPTFGRTIHGTRLPTSGNAFSFPAESRVPPGLATAGGTRLPEKARKGACRAQLLDADDVLRDGSDARLGGRNDALPVLVRFLVGQDGADIGGRAEILDRSHGLADVEFVVLADRQLAGVQNPDGGASRVQRVGGAGSPPRAGE